MFFQEDFASFYESFIAQYANSMYTSHIFQNQEETRAAAKNEMIRLFPDGLETKGQYLFKMKRDEEEIGVLWYAEKRSSDATTAWLCDIYVNPSFRRMGYAKAAIVKMETHLKSLGKTRVGMSVFATTPFAKDLYESLGYVVVKTVFSPDSKEILRYDLSKSL